MKFQKNYVYLLDNSGLGNQLYMLAYADYIRQQGYPTRIPNKYIIQTNRNRFRYQRFF